MEEAKPKEEEEVRWRDEEEGKPLAEEVRPAEEAAKIEEEKPSAAQAPAFRKGLQDQSLPRVRRGNFLGGKIFLRGLINFFAKIFLKRKFTRSAKNFKLNFFF